MKRICVFCGSSPAVDPLYTAAAEDLGRSLVSRDLGLVYGGSDRGLMGAIANSVLAAGGAVLGVIPRGLRSREIAHEGLTELFVVESMHERKQKMVDLSDAFVAMPGGFGTIDELAEVLTWRQLGLHAKPIGLLDVNGFSNHSSGSSIRPSKRVSFTQCSARNSSSKPRPTACSIGSRRADARDIRGT